LVETIGRDGYHLLTAIYQAEELPWLRELPAVEILRQVWVQQFWCDQGWVKQRPVKDMPPTEQWICSPYDVEARYSTRRQTTWIGYRVHVTETCDPDQPRLITQVETTTATTQDVDMTAVIQEDLAAHDRLPGEHLVDAGYVDADNLAHSQRAYQIDLIGPARPDTSWQAGDEEGLDITQFAIDWEAQSVTCPAGHQSVVWAEGISQYGTSVIRVHFPRSACESCNQRSHCTRGPKRGLTFRQREPHEALITARRREQTDEFKTTYRKRAGIEGTLSQVLRVCGLRRSRYVGLTKTHLHCIGAAAAINLVRVVNWLDEIPLAATRKSRFAALAA
jgi:transposase